MTQNLRRKTLSSQSFEVYLVSLGGIWPFSNLSPTPKNLMVSTCCCSRYLHAHKWTPYLSPWLLGIISSWDLWLNPLLEDRVILGNFPNLNDIEVFSNILPEHISTKIWHEDRESEKQNCSICESKQNPMSNFPGTQMSRWHLWWTLKRFTIFPLSSQSFRDTILG